MFRDIKKEERGKMLTEKTQEKIVELLEKLSIHIPNIIESYIKFGWENFLIIVFRYLINLIIMISILWLIWNLATNKIIDSSSIMGLVGTIVGYVFGTLYPYKR